MSANTQFVLLLVSFIGVLLLVTKPLGIYIADVMEGRPNFAVRAGARLERFLYKLCAIDVREETGSRKPGGTALYSGLQAARLGRRAAVRSPRGTVGRA